MAINIPGVQAEIVRRAFEKNKAEFLKYIVKSEKKTGKKVAIVGAGPSGLSCAAVLGTRGHDVTVFEKSDKPGGDLIYIPKSRFTKQQIDNDVKFVESCGDVKIKYNTAFTKDMEDGFDAVCYCIGMRIDNKLNVPGDEKSISGRKFLLKNPEEIKDKNVMIIGCGAVAIDCAVFALKNGAASAQILYRRTLNEAPLSTDERGLIDAFGLSIVQRTILQSIDGKDGKLILNTIRVDKNLNQINESEQKWNEIDFCVSAIGHSSDLNGDVIFSAGESNGKAMSAVQACASGKNAGYRIDAYLSGKEIPENKNDMVSSVPVFEPNMRPADISINVFGKKLASPLIAAASPITDNINSARILLKYGWGGLVIKVSSDPKYCVSYQKKSDEIYFKGEQTAENIKDISISLHEEFPNCLLIGLLDTDSPTFEQDLQTLELSKLDAIQIKGNKPFNITSKIPIINTVKYGTSSSEFSVVELRRNFTPNVYSDEKSKVPIKKEMYQKGYAVCGGISNDSDALYYLKNGALFVEVDPSQLERGGQEIEILNAMMSYFISVEGYSSLEDYIQDSKSFDIEDLQTERLVCKLTNPYVCIGCGRCTTCPNNAIDLEPAKWKYDVDLEKCVGCGFCVSRCPTGAISLVPKSEALKKSGH